MSRANRDDFSVGTKNQIARRAGWLCSFPGCRAPTIGATSDEKGEINIGTAAHICAAAPGGPRYDARMSPEERSSVSNGIWMCRDHGKAIDSSDTQFTVQRLREWKKQAEHESWQRVLRAESLGGSTFSANGDLLKRFQVAAGDDLNVFRNTAKWPSSSVELTLEVEGLNEPVSTSALARAVMSLEDLILVAAPGMGKTATIFQIAEGLLATDNGVPVVVPLGDWATDSASILDSILTRPAFAGLSEGEFRQVATRPGVVLLLDGWNELGAPARARARVQISRLKAEMPELGLVVATRKQTLDVPFSGAKVTVLPLSEAQQIEIAQAVGGEDAKKIVDRSWRTEGLRDLVSIPLYLTSLLMLPGDGPFPTTRGEILEAFVVAEEEEASRFEGLVAASQGFHQDFLESLAVFATRSGNTAVLDRDARRSISDTADVLEDDGQITSKPRPDEVLEGLVSHHVLMRTADGQGYSFQHQQFQEWFASRAIERRIVVAVDDVTAREALKLEILNLPPWEEPILFAVERLSHGDARQRAACAKVILAGLEVDPMLAAEMVYRSNADVWIQIASIVKAFVQRWHEPGEVDRALRFMLTSGRPDFLDVIWPLIASEQEQTQLQALRNCRRFRTSVLGNDADRKIATLPVHSRSVLLREISWESGVDGLELTTNVAKRDPSEEVRVSVIEALSFRRADRWIAELLDDSNEAVFDEVVRRGLVDVIHDEVVSARISAARQRLESKANPYDRLRAILRSRDKEDRGAALTESVRTIEIAGHQDPALSLIYEARDRYPAAVVAGVLARVREGRPLFFGTSEVLASSGLTLDDNELLQLALGNPGVQNGRAEAACSVLGAIAAGTLIDAFCEADALLVENGHADTTNIALRNGLQTRIAHLPGTSLVHAIFERASKADNRQMSAFAELLFRHPEGEDHARIFTAVDVAIIQGFVDDWGARLLASSEATRSQKANIATLASVVPSPALLPIMKSLLDDNLARLRAFREHVKLDNWRQSPALQEVRQPMTHQYQRAFMKIKAADTVAMMSDYLTDIDFGLMAARVLADQWIATNELPAGDRNYGGVDFSHVAERRDARKLNPFVTSAEAEAICAAIETLLMGQTSDEQKSLAVTLGVVALRLPHGNRGELVARLIGMANLRTRADLILSLVLSGKVIENKLVEAGIAATLEAAKTHPWMLTQSDGFELRIWLRLVPFVADLAGMLATLKSVPALQNDLWLMEDVASALVDLGSTEAEAAFFQLAADNPRMLQNARWLTHVSRFATPTSACRLLDLCATGALGWESVQGWQVSRIVGDSIEKFPELRSYAYALIASDPAKPGLPILARAVAENPDDAGFLLLVDLENVSKARYITDKTVERIVTESVPVEDWAGASSIMPVASEQLRKKLLERTTDGGPDDGAARQLRRIDWYRDEYGFPDTEPRHPDITSGRPWPIL